MSRMRFAVALIAAFAAIGTTDAGAAGMKLELAQWETLEPIPVGTPTQSWFQFWSAEGGYCWQAVNGAVLSNGAPKDQVSAVTLAESQCEAPGFSTSGQIHSVSWSAAGKGLFKMKPKLSLTAPGPCVYRYAKLAGTFEPGNFVNMEGTALGKLDAKASAAGCAATKTTAFEAGTEVESAGEREPLGSTVSR